MKPEDAAHTTAVVLGVGPGVSPEADGANYAATVYGLLLVTAVVASLDAGDVKAPAMIASVGVTMAIFWIAHVWAEAIADRMRDPSPFTWRRLGAAAHKHWPMVQAAVWPIVALALAPIGVWSLDTATWIAFVICVAQLVGWGFVVGLRSFRSWPAALLSGAVDGTLGLLIVLLKTLIH